MGNVIVAAGLQITRLKDDQEDRWQALWRAAISEFVAVLIFVFIGCGSVISAKTVIGGDNIPISGLTLISLSHGLTIVVLVYAVGEVSGGILFLLS